MIEGLRAFLTILTPRYIEKGLRAVVRGDVTYVVKSALSLTHQRRIQLPDLGVGVELFAPLRAEPGLPLVSVVIPCVNHGAFLLEAVNSVLAQTFPSIEIIIVDGGSDDGVTPSIVSALASPRVRVLLRESPPKVLGDNRNFGIAYAQGRYVCCLDADDVLAPTYIEKTLFLMEYGGYDVVGSSLVEFGARSNKWIIPLHPTLDDFTIRNQTICCALFRKSAWASVGGYSHVTLQREGIPEDWEFWVRLAAQGFRFRGISNETLLRYRVRGPGTSLSSAHDLPSHKIQRRALISRLNSLITNENRVFSRLQAKRRLRPLSSKTPNFHSLACSSTVNPATDSTARVRTILISLPVFHIGGGERVLSQIAEGLSKRGWKVIVVSTGAEDQRCGDSLPWFEKATAESYSLHRFLVPEEHKSFVWQLFRTRRPDVLLNAGSVATYSLLPEIADEFPEMARVDLLFNLVGSVRHHLKNRAFLTGAICENREVLDWLTGTAEWLSDRVAMIPNGVNTSLYTPCARPAFLSERFGIRASDIVVGWAGRMAEEKSPETFLELARRCSDIPGLRFVMAGDGPLAAKVAAAARRHGIAQLGLVEDMSNFYRLCDIFVLTSLIDGRPNVVLEAKASGCAVIASRVGGLPEIVVDGSSGLLVKPGDVASFEVALRQLVASPESLRRMRANAATAAKDFSLEMMVEGYQSALEQAARVAVELRSHSAFDPPVCLSNDENIASSAVN